MPTFRNARDIERYVASQKGFGQVLNSINIKSVLTKEAKRLENYLKEELEVYFNSYTPTVYKRTGATVRSIVVTEPRMINSFEWAIGITFDPSLANHPSYIGENQPEGYTPWLLEVGWDIRDKVGYDAPMFTHHPGTGYVTRAVERFNRENPYGLKITVTRNGSRYI